MRTTKVKRLWPVLALAPLFALAAILGVSLWHSGPGALTPPAAEAQDRGFTPEATVAYSEDCDFDTFGEDLECISDEDSLEVAIVAQADSDGFTVYVTGAAGAAATTGIDARHPNIQAKDNSPTPVPLGKNGIGEWQRSSADSPPPTRDTSFGASNDDLFIIDVQRDWADDDGIVYLFIDSEGQALASDATTIQANSASDDGIVRVFFTKGQGLNRDNTGIITGLGRNADVTRSANAVSTEARRFPIVSGTGPLTFMVKPSSASSGTKPGIGGQIEVATTFTAGSDLISGTASSRSDNVPTAATADAANPSVEAQALTATLQGWKESGPVEASVVITHIARDGARTPFDPIEFYRVGPAREVAVASQPIDDPHRTLSDPDDMYGPIVLRLDDALGQLVTAASQKIVIEGADDAAAAILDYDSESDRSGTYSAVDIDNDTDTGDAAGRDGYRLNIKVKDTADTGDYRVNLLVKQGSGDDEMTVATAQVTIPVIGAPTMMDGALAETTVNPGQSLELADVRFSADGQSAFAVNCHLSDTVEPSPRNANNSICDWSGKSPADRAVLEDGGMGSVYTDGTATIGVKDSAAAGTYTLVISDGRTGGTGVADKELQFTVRGRPTMYTLTGPDRIDAGDIANYTVKATDANGELPYLHSDVLDVGVVLLGASGYVSTLHVSSEGTVTLNNQGEASFTVVTAVNTPADTEVVIAIAGQGAAPSRKTVAIGPLALGIPGGLTLGTMADDTGTVTLSWTAGANSTRHWIAGIKQEDWDANNFADVIFMEAESQTGHTFTGLEGGKVYAFTVTAGNAAGEWSDWAPIRRVTVGTPAPTSGGGPGNPFGGGSN